MNRVEDDIRINSDDEEQTEALRLWFNLMKCMNLIEERLGQHLQSNYDTRLRSFDVLAQIDRPPSNPTLGELSRRLMVTTGNVTFLIDRLEREGLVERQPSPSDRRSHTVRLTAKGRALFDEILPEHNRILKKLLHGLGAENRSSLEKLLRRLRRDLTEFSE
ncbi:MAG: MarR family transcriptional regulator [Fimbriimonadaceae bacterium]|nr:MarR family transcriptional regulator [Alphaproteobacteria bacterium]